MKHVWLNNKQPDENGDIVLEIVNNKGNRVSTFRGKTIDDVAEQLADAQVNANRQLGRKLNPDVGRIPMQMQPRELTSADRLRLSSEITDPNKIVEVVDEIVTAKQGAPPAVVGKKFSEFDQREADEYYREEAEAFVADYPEYYPVQENQEKLFAALREAKYDLTRNNLAIVFQQLYEQGKLVEKPDDDNEQDEPPTPPAPPVPPAPAPPPAPRPRSYSSGLRNSDASASRPAPKPRTPVITKAMLETMSRAEYNQRLQDPAFRRAVDAL
jgi:hypothetical protein